MQLPRKVNLIINLLYENGFEAFAVGGCVRDALLGKEPHDWDITTSASPEQVKGIFCKTIDTGIEHGTVTVMIGGEGFEVTTYRVDGSYEDSRHPKEVVFTSSLVEDLKRRDFTINAMAYNDREGLVDEFDGQKDLSGHMIRCVGDAMERFNEDALRILRAARFSAQLGFDIEESTKQAMSALAGKLENISAERIKAEMDKILLSDNCDRILLMEKLGITGIIMPEFDEILATGQENPNHIYDVGMHTIVAMKMLDGDSENETVRNLDGIIDKSPLKDEKTRLILKWTMLLHDMGKPRMKTIDEDGVAHFKKHQIVSVEIAEDIFRRLKFDNYTSDTAKVLIKWHDLRFSSDIKSVRKAVSKIGDEYIGMLFLVQRADILAQNPNTVDEKIRKLTDAYKCYLQIKANNECLMIKDLAVNGRDLIQTGIQAGPVMGKIMEKLLEKVLDNPADNEKDILLKYALEIYGAENI